MLVFFNPLSRVNQGYRRTKLGSAWPRFGKNFCESPDQDRVFWFVTIRGVWFEKHEVVPLSSFIEHVALAILVDAVLPL